MGSPRRVIEHRQAVRAGVGHFVTHRSIDMSSLAGELSVSRATLYRVVGSRDRLFGDVLWVFGSAFFQDSVKDTASRGAERLLEVLRRFGERIFASEEFRSLLTNEPDTAVRVLFTSAGGIHERFVEVNRDLIQSTVDAGEFSSPFDVDSLAYVLVRLYESMWYADLLIGRQPDPDLVEHLARALLTGEPGA